MTQDETTPGGSEATVSPATVERREAEWGRLTEDESERIVQRVCEPLANIPSKKKKYKVVGLTREYYQERLRLQSYSAGLHYPGEERDRAMKAHDEATYMRWCQAGIYQRVVDKLRLLQLSLLGCPEHLLAYASIEEQEAYHLRLEQREELIASDVVKGPKELSLREVFLDTEDYGLVLKNLEKQGFISFKGHWIQQEKGSKSKLLALICALTRKHYLKPLPQAVLKRTFSRYFEVEISNSYATRPVDEKLVEMFAALFPDQRGVMP